MISGDCSVQQFLIACGIINNTVPLSLTIGGQLLSLITRWFYIPVATLQAWTASRRTDGQRFV